MFILNCGNIQFFKISKKSSLTGILQGYRWTMTERLNGTVYTGMLYVVFEQNKFKVNNILCWLWSCFMRAVRKTCFRFEWSGYDMISIASGLWRDGDKNLSHFLPMDPCQQKRFSEVCKPHEVLSADKTTIRRWFSRFCMQTGNLALVSHMDQLFSCALQNSKSCSVEAA